MNPILIILLVVAFTLAFGIGANDETMSTVAGSRALSLKSAIMIGGILSFIGCFFFSENVGKTIGASMLGTELRLQYNTFMMLSVILSTTIWLIVASRTGAPISTTHSVVGSIFGISIVWSIATSSSFISSINWSKIGQVVLGWVISPIFGFCTAVVFQIVINKVMRKRSKGLIQVEQTERYFIIVLLIAVCLTQLSRGGNDAANAIGVFYGMFDAGILLEEVWKYPLLAITGIMIVLGLVIIGRNVIKAVGGGLVEMKPSNAFAISISTTIVLFIATTFGFPVSGSHILIFAILGSGWVKGEKPDKKSFRKMVVSWFLTFPVAAALSALIYTCFLPFG